MRKTFIILIIGLIVIEIQLQRVNGQTYCNPMNLSYQFCQDQPSRREASDPTIVLFKEEYYLFATNAGGYWHSKNLHEWKLIQTTGLPLKNLAPTAIVIGDWMYFFTSLSSKIYRSNNPSSGKWEVYNNSFPLSMVSDLGVFVDTDGRVYCYYGCTNNEGVMVRELDVNNKLNPKGVPMVCQLKNTSGQGWKRPGSKNKKTNVPGIEGSWMNKYKGKYYFQFTEPDNEYKNYNEVVYVSDHPFGPFTYAANNPFLSRPKGFVCAAGKGSTFADKYGNWWHITTLTAPEKLKSEPRLGLFPASFDAEGNLFTTTDFGDYPIIMPNLKYTDIRELNPGWSLLSYNKKAEASSSMSTNPVELAFDENIGTFWSAKNANQGEWLSVDLGSMCTVNAVQVNFADNKTKFLGRVDGYGHQYLLQFSADKKTWNTLVDKTANTDELTHQFEVMSVPVQARYVKIINHCVPDGTFAISGFRVFGTGTSPQPTIVNSFLAERDRKDQQKIKLSWYGKQKNVTGFNIRYGTQKNKLYQSYQVFKNTPVIFQGLDKNKTYWFEIDAFGENGVTPSKVHGSH